MNVSFLQLPPIPESRCSFGAKLMNTSRPAGTQVDEVLSKGGLTPRHEVLLTTTCSRTVAGTDRRSKAEVIDVKMRMKIRVRSKGSKGLPDRVAPLASHFGAQPGAKVTLFTHC